MKAIFEELEEDDDIIIVATPQGEDHPEFVHIKTVEEWMDEGIKDHLAERGLDIESMIHDAGMEPTVETMLTLGEQIYQKEGYDLDIYYDTQSNAEELLVSSYGYEGDENPYEELMEHFALYAVPNKSVAGKGQKKYHVYFLPTEKALVSDGKRYAVVDKASVKLDEAKELEAVLKK